MEASSEERGLEEGGVELTPPKAEINERRRKKMSL